MNGKMIVTNDNFTRKMLMAYDEYLWNLDGTNLYKPKAPTVVIKKGWKIKDAMLDMTNTFCDRVLG